LKIKKKKIRKALAYTSVLAFLFTIVLIIISPSQPFNDPYSTIVFDKNNKLIGAKIASDGQWRFPASDSIPLNYKLALLEFEDQHFYAHPGFNPFSLFRALRQNINQDKIVSGGSTISMQLIRLAGKGKERSYFQKIREILLAFGMELKTSKKEILCLYASHAPFGSNVVGLDAAAWRYFGRSPFELSWAEAATLAVLPNAPALIHPGRNRKALKEKRNRLLDRLFLNKTIDSTTLVVSKLEIIPLAPKSLPQQASHLLGQILKTKAQQRVYSTIDAGLQNQLLQIIERHHKKLSQNEIHNAAILVLDTESGEVLSYIGNTKDKKNRHANYVDIIRSPRSYGSILKPFLYAAMLDAGKILPNTLVADIPSFFSGYSPKNFDHDFDGAVPASRVLERSLNVPAVRMLKKYGVEGFHHRLQKAGISTLNRPSNHYGLSLILGGGEGTLWEITGLYASLARQLIHFQENSSKYDPEDIHPPIYQKSKKKKKPFSELVDYSVFSAGASWLSFKALLEVNRPEGELGWKYFSSSKQIAWKTGTSFGFRDAWAVGVCPEFTVGVWVGNADGEGRAGLIGVQCAAPIMFDVFDALPSTNWFDPPFDELIEVAVCKQSGHRPSANCPEIDTIFALEQDLQTEPCPYHQLIHLDKEMKHQVTVNCYGSKDIQHKSWFVLPPVQAWYFKNKNSTYKNLPPVHPGCQKKERSKSIEFIYPQPNAQILIPTEIDGTAQEIIVDLAHAKKNTLVYWHLDRKYIGSTSHFHQMAIRPKKGNHRISVVDTAGNEATLKFEILN
jgi:penicillin-binding protein 1C